jgi:hypothetical protein
MAETTPNFVEELVDYLVTETVASTKGTDIFYRELPAEPDLAPATMICLKDTGGVPAINSPIPDVSVQVLVRSNAWLAGRTKCGEIFNKFHAIVGLALTNYNIKRAVALQLPQDLGKDNQGRYLFSYNIMFLAHQLDEGDDDNGFGGHKDLYDPFTLG